MSDLLHISSSPHVRSKVSTSGIMGTARAAAGSFIWYL